MDSILLDDGSRRLKISCTGIDAKSRTASPSTLKITLYAYDEGPPVTPITAFVLDLQQAARLYSYLHKISLVRDPKLALSGRFVELEGEPVAELLEALKANGARLMTPDLIRAVLKFDPTMCRTILETEIDTIDVQSLAYRREQLHIMQKLLTNEVFFETTRQAHYKAGPEAVWQEFFEQNPWIFGLALHYVIGEGVDPKRLEQVVAGHSIGGHGKRTDALLRTRGALQSLCYVEIKTHRTALLHGAEYRPGVWRPSDELVGAVSQVQMTVQLAVQHLGERLDLKGEIFFNYAPRSVVVCGSLTEFGVDADIASGKYACFELYRRNIANPTILTFDELYNRAKAVVEADISGSREDLSVKAVPGRPDRKREAEQDIKIQKPASRLKQED